MKIDTIDQFKFGQVSALHVKEIASMQVLIPTIERLGKTRELTLHVTLDASVLSHVHVGTGEVVRDCFLLSGGCIESMTHLMTHEKVVGIIIKVFPDWEDKHTTVYVEGCCLTYTVLNHKVFSSEQFGELTFDLLSAHMCPLVCTYNSPPEAPECSWGTVCELSLVQLCF